jgi:L-ascorbate metabolism protein UlaG (beta-lactamase superfamily)
MHIKKLGHCCLRIELQGIVILTDPGAWSTMQNEEKGIQIILITHEHQDHLHVDSVKAILRNNPEAQVVTNIAVGTILEKEGIPYTKISGGEASTILGTLIEGFGHEHAPIIAEITPVENTSYRIGESVYIPGDAFMLPNKQVDVLALPVCGPWMHMSEAVAFARAVNPRVAFPVHDGMLKIIGPFHFVPGLALEKSGIKFVPMVEGDEKEF